MSNCYFCDSETNNTNPSDDFGHVLCDQCRGEIEKNIEEFETSETFNQGESND